MQPSAHSTFFRFTKADEETRTVYGRATQEVVDRDGEIMDYASSKPEFERWSAEVSQDTDGKSLGNVRSMHGNISAGVLKDIQFDDHEKAIDVAAKITDDNEWKKVLEGNYSGFSIGGRYKKKWPDILDGRMVNRFTAVPSEISIVDRPCVATAKFFSIHKRDGSTRQVIFHPFKLTLRKDAAVPVRKVVELKRGPDGLFVQPTTVGPEYELEETHRRLGFAKSHFYADRTCGDPRAFDPNGDYPCGGCNKADGSKCLFVCDGEKIGVPLVIDRIAGSCKHWEDLFAGDPELSANNQTVVHANYGVRKGGKPGRVFGCHECPFMSVAYQPDSQGRKGFCGKGCFRVDPMACCELNGAETMQ